ncbi:hypothetical protein BDZ94DRAFT_1327548 [Collybia nuda]|uniref:Uncharacterized protein n=1 Tax=Collybia nuda TaxID=64659 RepID=A0A9P5XR66_9AGAR|nr:hypothetical protein BDZ94DRAFT_1327548 [Collybia nuda]
MDEYFDIKQAAIMLRKVMGERLPKSEGHAVSKHLATFKCNGLVVKKFTDPKSWRIVKASTSGDTCEELVLTMQGVLGDINLPPLSSTEIPRVHRIAFLRQHVGLIGLGTPEFSTYTDKMLEVFQMISASMPEGYLQPWSPTQLNNHYQINAHSRYFTSEKEAKNLDAIPFSSLVDPTGVLGRMASRDFVHTIDNEVQYLIYTNRDGVSRYDPIDPAIFRTGDIVEIQFTVMAIPLRGIEQAKPLVILRALTLVDNSFSKEAYLKRAKAAIKPVKEPTVTLKLRRKVGYDDEEQDVRQSRHAIASLNLEDAKGAQGKQDITMNEI